MRTRAWVLYLASLVIVDKISGLVNNRHDDVHDGNYYGHHCAELRHVDVKASTVTRIFGIT